MPDVPEDAGTEDEGDVVVIALDDEGSDADDDANEQVVDVWTCNLTAARVFQLCTVQGISIGMGGVWWQGIEIGEIRNACEMLELPHEQWAGITWDVRYMGRCVAQERNQRAEQDSKRRRANA